LQDHTTYTANEQYFADCLGIHNVEEEDDGEDVIEVDNVDEDVEGKESLCFPIGQSLELHSVHTTSVSYQRCLLAHPHLGQFEEDTKNMLKDIVSRFQRTEERQIEILRRQQLQEKDPKQK
jgi:hypothetical protein